MAQNAEKQSRVLLVIFGILGLLVLSLRLLGKGMWTMKPKPQSVITKVLKEVGISDPTIRFWVAVSAFETAGWTSRVFNDSNNLFCIIVPGSKRLQYGEGQTIFDSLEDSVYGLYNRVMKPFKYPAHVQSIDELVAFMKSKNYFTSDAKAYTSGVKQWYSKLFPND